MFLVRCSWLFRRGGLPGFRIDLIGLLLDLAVEYGGTHAELSEAAQFFRRRSDEYWHRRTAVHAAVFFGHVLGVSELGQAGHWCGSAAYDALQRQALHVVPGDEGTGVGLLDGQSYVL